MTTSWYHGAQQELSTIRIGSSITQNRDIARVFSHRPPIVSMEEDGRLKHNGTVLGYLYIIDEAVNPEDIYPHPHPINQSEWEWLTKRELTVRRIERPKLIDSELLTEEDLAELEQRRQAAGIEVSQSESFRVDE